MRTVLLVVVGLVAMVLGAGWVFGADVSRPVALLGALPLLAGLALVLVGWRAGRSRRTSLDHSR